MDLFWWWWIAAIALIAFELATGTVYLLMVAAGMSAGGLAAWLGQGFAVQLFVAAIVAGVGCLIVQRRRALLPLAAESQRNQDVQIDLGNRVTVDSWNGDGTAQVQYRGAQWTARLDAGQGAPSSGSHSIVAMQGNTLVLKPLST